MKKSMKAKRAPAQPVAHPPVLDAKSDSPKGSAPAAERHVPAQHRGPKGSR